MILLAVAGVFWFGRSNTALAPQAMPEAITARTPTARTPATPPGPALDATGYVTARREATVSARIAGQVTEVLVEEGDKVKAGQLLAKLDSDELIARYRVVQAQLAAARAQLPQLSVQQQQAQVTLQRVKALAQRHEASQADLDDARFALQNAQAKQRAAASSVEVTRRQVQLQAEQLDGVNIRAPFDGIVTDKAAQPGEIISPFSGGAGFSRTGICTIVDMGSLEIDVDVNEANIHRVFPGQAVTATLDAYPDWQMPARVITIIPTADRSKGTVRVRIKLLVYDARILPDMAVKVGFHESSPASPASRATEDSHHG